MSNCSLHDMLSVSVVQGSKEYCIVRGGLYRHFKGGVYQVLEVATDVEDGTELVIYRSLSRHQEQVSDKVWARPVSVFCESVVVGDVRTPRFQLIGIGVSPDEPIATEECEQ